MRFPNASRVLLLAAVVVLAFESAVAQDNAKDILRAALSAHANGVSIQNVVIHADKIGTEGRREAFQVYAGGSQRLRIEQGSGSAKFVSVFDQGNAFVEQGSASRSLPSEGAPQRVTWVPFMDLLSEVQNPDLTAEVQDTVTLGRATAYRVRVRLRDLHPEKRLFGRALDEETIFYIDAQTHLILRSERMVSPAGNLNLKVPSIHEFSDYRMVDGVVIPFRIVTAEGSRASGQNTSVIEVQSVEINRGIPPSLFEKGGAQ